MVDVVVLDVVLLVVVVVVVDVVVLGVVEGTLVVLWWTTLRLGLLLSIVVGFENTL